jgi:dTDP-glucose 4,6-dehydratase
MAMLDTIVAGTRRALDFAAGSGVRRFLLTSSGAVYGGQPTSMTHVPETYRGAPETADARSVYGEGKRVAELLCGLASRQHGFDSLVARCFAFVGPHLALDAHFAIGNFIGDCLAGRPIEIRGDGTPHRSYLYAADLAVWLWTILTRGEGARVYNVGAERSLSIAELARVVTGALGSSSPVRVLGPPRPGAVPDRYVPDTSRARKELGLEEWIGVEEGIRRTARWYSEARTPGL